MERKYLISGILGLILLVLILIIFFNSFSEITSDIKEIANDVFGVNIAEEEQAKENENVKLTESLIKSLIDNYKQCKENCQKNNECKENSGCLCDFNVFTFPENMEIAINKNGEVLVYNDKKTIVSNTKIDSTEDFKFGYVDKEGIHQSALTIKTKEWEENILLRQIGSGVAGGAAATATTGLLILAGTAFSIPAAITGIFMGGIVAFGGSNLLYSSTDYATIIVNSENHKFNPYFYKMLLKENELYLITKESTEDKNQLNELLKNKDCSGEPAKSPEDFKNKETFNLIYAYMEACAQIPFECQKGETECIGSCGNIKFNIEGESKITLENSKVKLSTPKSGTTTITSKIPLEKKLSKNLKVLQHIGSNFPPFGGQRMSPGDLELWTKQENEIIKQEIENPKINSLNLKSNTKYSIIRYKKGIEEFLVVLQGETNLDVIKIDIDKRLSSEEQSKITSRLSLYSGSRSADVKATYKLLTSSKLNEETNIIPQDARTISLMLGLLAQESDFKPEAISPTGCIGLAQICYSTSTDITRLKGAESCKLYDSKQENKLCIKSGKQYRCCKETDPRLDPEKAILSGYEIYKNKEKSIKDAPNNLKEYLTLTAYNTGEACVNKAITNANGKTDLNSILEGLKTAIITDKCLGNTGYFATEKNRKDKAKEASEYAAKVLKYRDGFLNQINLGQLK